MKSIKALVIGSKSCPLCDFFCLLVYETWIKYKTKNIQSLYDSCHMNLRISM